VPDGLKVNFVNRATFISLRKVKAESLEKSPEDIEDPNLVKAYNAKDAVIKSNESGNIDEPVYTTRAQACTAGFLRVRVGMQAHSHMMFHLLGINQEGLSPVERASKELPEKLEEFFNNLDKLISLAKESNEQIYIDHVTIGSIENSIGDLPQGSQCEPLSSIKANSGELRKYIEKTVSDRVSDIQKLAKQESVEVSFSESSFTGQTSTFTGKHPVIPMSHMHYDPETNTLNINADYYTEIIGESQIHGSDIISPTAISKHYSNIEVAQEHISPELETAMRISKLREQTVNNAGMRSEALAKALRHAFTQADIKIPTQAKILDLACGPCSEASTLINFFGGSKNGTQLTGVDVMEPEIIIANEMNRDNPNTNFLQGDATNLNLINGVPEKVDIVSIRHQFVSSDPDVWEGIFQQGLDRLKNDGTMVLTSYTRYEHKEMLELMQRLGAKVVYSGENPGRKEIPINNHEDRKVLGIDGVELKDGERAHYSHVAIIKKA
jgi:hypothetical protein